MLVVLNVIGFLGYSVIGLVIAGQILSAVSADGNLSIAVGEILPNCLSIFFHFSLNRIGIVIVALVCWIMSTLGIRVFMYFERYIFMLRSCGQSNLYLPAMRSYPSLL